MTRSTGTSMTCCGRPRSRPCCPPISRWATRSPSAMLVEFADRFDHLIGINSSHQDLGYLTALIDALGDRLEIHVGGPQLALTALALGATGYLSSEGNLAPHLCVGVIDGLSRQRRQAHRAPVRHAAPAVGHVLRGRGDPRHQERPQCTRSPWRLPASPPAARSRGDRARPSRARSSDSAWQRSRAGRRPQP